MVTLGLGVGIILTFCVALAALYVAFALNRRLAEDLRVSREHLEWDIKYLTTQACKQWAIGRSFPIGVSKWVNTYGPYGFMGASIWILEDKILQVKFSGPQGLASEDALDGLWVELNGHCSQIRSGEASLVFPYEGTSLPQLELTILERPPLHAVPTTEEKAS